MKRARSYYSIFYISLLGAGLGYFFRSSQLSGGSLIPIVAFSALLVCIFGLGAGTLEKNSVYAEVYRKNMADLCFSVLAAAGLAGCAILEGTASTMSAVLCVMGMIAAASMLFSAILRVKGEKPSVPAGVLVILFYIVRLFRDFRLWEIDPNITHYCFQLFAMICYMLVSYHAVAYCYDKGARRRLAFFAVTGVLFSGISMAGADLGNLCLYGGSLLWMLACALQMLRKAEN